MKLGGIFEIIVFCDDMSAQVAFYRDVLGLAVTHPTGVDDFSDQHWVTFETGACTLALHSGGEAGARQSAPKFVFSSDDLESSRKHLAAANVEVSEIREPAPGVAVFDGTDPEGNVFSVEHNVHVDVAPLPPADGALTDAERADVDELVSETMAKRNDEHLDFLLNALHRAPGEDDENLELRRKIHRALCFIDSDVARDALRQALRNDSNDAVDPIIEGIWKQQYLLLKVLPGELLANYEKDDGDARYARRLIEVLKKHRVTEKIGTDWLADAPDDLEKKVTPRPLWA